MSASSLSSTGDQLLLGAENGDVHTVDLRSFQLLDNVVRLDTVMHR